MDLKSTFGVGAVSPVIRITLFCFFFYIKFSIAKLLIKSNTSAQAPVQPSATEGAVASRALKAAPPSALHECCVTSDGIVQAQLNLQESILNGKCFILCKCFVQKLILAFLWWIEKKKNVSAL